MPVQKPLTSVPSCVTFSEQAQCSNKRLMTSQRKKANTAPKLVFAFFFI